MVKEIQGALGLVQDGIPGPKTIVAVHQRLCAEKQQESPIVDERSERNISTLHPALRSIARNFLELCAKQNLGVKIICGTRTFSEQAELFAKGRTIPGAKVTEAGPGQSMHNFGLAFDIGVFDGKEYIPESNRYVTAGAIGKSLGLDWGGDFKKPVDQPHFELRPSWAKEISNSQMLAELRRRMRVGTNVI